MEEKTIYVMKHFPFCLVIKLDFSQKLLVQTQVTYCTEPHVLLCQSGLESVLKVGGLVQA